MSFSELAVVLLVALIFLGPEKMPKLAYMLGQLWSRVQKNAEQFNQTFEKHLNLDQNKKRAEAADKLYEKNSVKDEAK